MFPNRFHGPHSKRMWGPSSFSWSKNTPAWTLALPQASQVPFLSGMSQSHFASLLEDPPARAVFGRKRVCGRVFFLCFLFSKNTNGEAGDRNGHVKSPVKASLRQRTPNGPCTWLIARSSGTWAPVLGVSALLWVPGG